MRTRSIPVCGAVEDRDRPTAGAVEQRDVPAESVRIDGRRLRGVVPYGVESRDLGGFREIIERGALRNARLDGLVCTVNHTGVPLARHPDTLEIEDRDDGLAWSLELPESRADVREAVERGDLRAGSWRMIVRRDEWRGDVRHIHEIAELRDVSVVTDPAYESARVELRSAGGNDDRTPPRGDRRATGALRVEDRDSARPPRSLAEEFRAAGFPGEPAVIPWDAYEARAVTWTGSVDAMAPTRRQGERLPADSRYLWPVMTTVGVDEGTTSVDVVRQSARSLATPASMNDATTDKPETGSTIEIVSMALRQLATVQSGIPNLYLEQPGVNAIIEGDLRMALNEALDAMAVAAVAASGFEDPAGVNLLVAIRAAITTLRAAGYAPDTLVLTPAADEQVDTMVSGVAGASADFVFAPGSFAPGELFGLRRRVSKAAAAPIVVDATAFGRLYASRVSLATFEENAGKTNTSLIRLETHGVVGVERQDAAVRIAAA